MDKRKIDINYVSLCFCRTKSLNKFLGSSYNDDGYMSPPIMKLADTELSWKNAVL